MSPLQLEGASSVNSLFVWKYVLKGSLFKSCVQAPRIQNKLNVRLAMAVNYWH
jgi:hypothetical protein